MYIAASLPFELVPEYFPKLEGKQLPLELVIKAEVLDTLSFSDFKGWAKRFKSAEIPLTVHLPFMDLSLAALDPWIRKVSLLRLERGLEVSTLFEPKLSVFHSGYHSDYHRDKAQEWLEILIDESLEIILSKAKNLGLSLALENTFEPTADFLKPVFTTFAGSLFWCFDPGHAKVFSQEDELLWFDKLKPFLREIHCHDNLGVFDNHLPLGEGVVKFKEILAKIKTLSLNPILTIEARSEESFLKSYRYLRENLGF